MPYLDKPIAERRESGAAFRPSHCIRLLGLKFGFSIILKLG